MAYSRTRNCAGRKVVIVVFVNRMDILSNLFPRHCEVRRQIGAERWIYSPEHDQRRWSAYDDREEEIIRHLKPKLSAMTLPDSVAQLN